MTSITIPFIPSTLWVLSSAVTITILLIMFIYFTYQRRREKYFLKDTDDIAELASKKQILQAEVAELRNWIKEQKTELESLVGEREEQERLREELSHLEQECAKKEQENLLLRKEIGELENQRHILRKELTYLEKEIQQNEEKKQEIEKIVSELNIKKANLTDLKDKIKKEEEKLHDLFQQIARNQVLLLEVLEEQKSKQNQLEKINKEIHDIKVTLEKSKTQQKEAKQLLDQLNEEIIKKQNEINFYKKEIEEVRDKKDKIESIITRYKDAKEKLENNLLELKKQYNGKEDELEKIDKELEYVTKQLEDAKTRQKDANQLLKQLNEEIAQKQDELEKYKKEIEKVYEYKKEIDGIINQKQAEKVKLEIEIRELLDYRHALKREIKEMEDRLNLLSNQQNDDQKGELTPFKDLFEKPPICLSNKEFPVGPIDREVDEVNLLYDFQNKLKKEGIYFSERVIKAFHTSLKCQFINPLTVLAGVSGTGKTLLPIKYAKMLGIHSLIIPVQPRWDSPQDLFGFYNYLERKYKATELLKALIRMDKYNTYVDNKRISDFKKARERMLLVLLDEMNLARTEYYFSEFLSKLEIRRLVDPNNDVERQRAELIIDTGTGYAEQLRVWVGENVLFVGTMNEDETTQTLSDKVLDRANVLRFGKPDENTRPVKNDNKASGSTRYLPTDIWKSWIRSFDENVPWNDEVKRWIKKLNSALERVGRPFGFRVEEAINTYIVNYPGVDKDNYKIPFADQLEQKIIPKLRGLDTNDTSTHCVIETIKEIIDEVNDTELSKAFEDSLENSRSIGMFHWSGVTRKVDF